MTGEAPKPKRVSWWILAWAWLWAKGDRKFQRNQKLFMTLLKDPRSGLEGVCRQHAQRMANAMMMNYLDGRRVQHCRFCPSTSPLRKIGLDYFCKHHELLAGNERVGNAVKGGT